MAAFGDVPKIFPEWLKPETRVIKACVAIG